MLISVFCVKVVHATGAYLKWHSPEWSDHKRFFPDDPSDLVGRMGNSCLLMSLTKSGFLFHAWYIFPAHYSNTAVETTLLALMLACSMPLIISSWFFYKH